ncbi:MAG: NUDIX hydrolase [Rhodoferax sp.]
MLQETAPEEIIPRDSATVVLLRDGAQGLEVFLMQRSGLSDAFGAAYVFPGGKLDPADLAPEVTALLDTPAATLAPRLGEPALAPERAAGLFVAAIRELFEESGVLLAHSDTRPHSAAPEHWQQWLHSQHPRLRASALQPWSRWITPRLAAMSKKRFDTRFFVALAPAHQEARHDDFETTASAWLSPRAALQRYAEGSIEMAPPQIMSLAHLARFARAHEVLADAAQRTPPCICPEGHADQGGMALCYPGDPLHSVSERALPGPTRLLVRQRRFEPEGGLESLWA